MAKTTKNTLAVLPPGVDEKMFMILFFIGECNWNWLIMELEGRIYFKDEIVIQQVTNYSKDNVKIFEKIRLDWA